MTHRMVFTEYVPTLALVALGASETIVGLQRAFEPVGQLLQLPTLRAVRRFSKRAILIGGHVFALVAGAPLLLFGLFAERGASLALPVVLASLAASAAGIVISQTVWYPLLRGYVEPDRIGRFFGTLRTGWHLTLIVYFLGAQYWLSLHPGAFTPLFAVGFACGLLRVVLIWPLPERPEHEARGIRVRQALALLRSQPALRRYLLGVGGEGAVRAAVVPFVIVMMRRVIGLGEGEVLVTTAAHFAGGLVSLYLWGRVVDRVGPALVFRWTALGMACLFAALLLVRGPGTSAVVAMTAFFFLLAVLHSGFGVAETHVLFQLAPPAAPARVIVVGIVGVSLFRGAAPLAAGIALDRILASGAEPLAVYHGLFLLAAGLQATVFLPLRGFRH